MCKTVAMGWSKSELLTVPFLEVTENPYTKTHCRTQIPSKRLTENVKCRKCFGSVIKFFLFYFIRVCLNCVCNGWCERLFRQTSHERGENFIFMVNEFPYHRNWYCQLATIEFLKLNWLIDWLTKELTDWLTDRWLIDWMANWPTDLSTDCLTDKLTNWLMNWLSDWQTPRQTKRLIQPTDWLA